jgi:hypothetical protein
MLKVYSATDSHNDGDVVYFPHSDYGIHGADGQLIKKVRNAISNRDEQPTTVRLPTGRYKVVAEADYYGHVEVPVVIEGGRLTEVHLDGRWKAPNVSVADAKLVRFPSGRVVGWRAMLP